MASIGRNNPCSCGSGKKFKKCCGSAAVHNKNERVRIVEEEKIRIKQERAREDAEDEFHPSRRSRSSRLALLMALSSGILPR